MTRYFLTEAGLPEREVTKAEFVAAERRCGFHNTLNQPDEPATSGFSSTNYGKWPHEVRGRVEQETQ